MPLKIKRRADRGGALTITGSVQLPDGTRVDVRARAQSDDPALAREEAASLEARILRDAWHGKRRGARSFLAAVESYLLTSPRSTRTKALLRRIALAAGDVALEAVDQEFMDSLRRKTLPAGAAPATVLRNLVTPTRAVLVHAYRRDWCAAPQIEKPRVPPGGRTRYLVPAEAEQLLAAAAPHLQPLLLFLLGTGARLSEALELDWRDLDLAGGRVIFWRTKGAGRRDAELPARLVAALAVLPDDRAGAVFRWTRRGRPGGALVRQPYADNGREAGGQIKTGFGAALRRARLDPELSPHDLRHTWASWHYAQHRDLLLLKRAGNWSSVALVERYAHLLPAGAAAAIGQFWQGAAGESEIRAAVL